VSSGSERGDEGGKARDQTKVFHDKTSSREGDKRGPNGLNHGGADHYIHQKKKILRGKTGVGILGGGKRTGESASISGKAKH